MYFLLHNGNQAMLFHNNVTKYMWFLNLIYFSLKNILLIYYHKIITDYYALDIVLLKYVYLGYFSSCCILKQNVLGMLTLYKKYLCAFKN